MTNAKKRIACISLRENHWIQHILDALPKLDWEVRLFEIQPETTAQSLFQQIQDFSPTFCLTRNFYVFDLFWPEGFAFLDIMMNSSYPIVCWFLDQPQSSGTLQHQVRWQQVPPLKNFYFFVVDPTHLPYFQKRNLPCSYLPLGVPEALESFRSTPEKQKAFAADLSFVGAPPFASDLPLRDDSELIVFGANCAMNDLLRVLSAVSPPSDHERLSSEIQKAETTFQKFCGQHFFSRSSYALQRSLFIQRILQVIPPSLQSMEESLQGRMDMTYSFVQMARLVLRLIPHNLKIYGGAGWKSFLPETAGPTPRLSLDDCFQVFASSRISFCYTKWQVMNSVAERQLLVSAVGGFPLTDFREVLYDFFAEDSIAVYRSPEEAEDLAQYYLAHEDERKKMSEQAREGLFRSHTYRHRCKQLIDKIYQHFF